MEKLLKNELFRSFILSIVIFAVLMIGTATSVINSYWQGVLILCGINIILAVSLNLAAGYLGQLTLGHAGFMSVGAYTSALISIYLNLPFIVSLLIGAIAAGVIGLIIGIPVLRLKGDYLCIITLAFNEIIRVVMNNLEITNGAKGLIGIPLNTNLVYVFIAMIITIFVVYSIVKMKQHQNYLVLMLVIIKYLPLQSVLFLQDLQEDYMHIIIQLSFLKDLTSTNQLKF